MYKRGSGRYLVIGILVLVLAVGVIAEEAVMQKVSNLSNETETFVKDVVQGSNISADSVNDIAKVDLNNPPEDVEIGRVENGTNVAIYQVNYTQNDENKKLFVVTYGGPTVTPPEALLEKASNIQYLHFGESEIVDGSEYLNTATGVRSSAEQGYVIIDKGSITGLSTSIEVVRGETGGKIILIVYKNGEDSGMRNVISAENAGVEKDYDTQSAGVIKFQPGDVISVYVKVEGNVQWKNSINLVKINTMRE